MIFAASSFIYIYFKSNNYDKIVGNVKINIDNYYYYCYIALTRRSNMDKKYLTTSQGIPVGSDLSSITTGEKEG